MSRQPPPGPGGFFQNAAQGEQTRQHPADAVGKHLPRGPGPLAEDEVAGKAADGSAEKARLRAEGNAREHDNGQHGLKVGHKAEGCPAGYRQGAQHSQEHQLPGLGLAAFKVQEEGGNGQDDDGQAREIKALLQPGKQHHRQGYQKHHNGQAQPKAPVCFSRVHVKSFSFIRDTTSSAVTAWGNRWRLMRLAAVV